MPRPYPVNLTGTKSYQPAIAGICEGEPAFLLHEPENPYDDRAIAVVAAFTGEPGETIGYLPRDSWIADALLDENKGCRAKIKRLSRGQDGITGVTLEIILDGDPIGVRGYRSTI